MDHYESMAMSLEDIYECHSILLQFLEKTAHSSELCGQEMLKTFSG